MFACLHIPDFPVAAVVRAEPELLGHAVAVVEGVPPQLTVSSANAKARADGVAAGMTELEAQAYSPSLMVRRRSAELELGAQAALAELAQSVSPRIEIAAPDTVLLDLAGLDRLLGPPAKLANDLAERVAALGLAANIGVAANPDAAFHAARGFAGITLIPAGREAERLGNLPLEVLLHPSAGPLEGDRPTEILETLDRWGVRTFRGLAALPEVAVAERLGEEGLRLQKLARGAGSRTLQCADEELHFEETLEPESPVENLEPLAFLLGQMLDSLCSRLRERALAVQELRVRLDLDSPRRHEDTEEIGSSGDRVIESLKETNDGSMARTSNHSILSSVPPCLSGEIHERTLRFPVPLADARIFLKLLHLDLAAHPPAAPVLRITLAAEPTKPRVVQNGLFLPKAPQPEKLELVLARLAAAGAEDAGSPRLLDTHRPGAFRVARFEPSFSPRRHGDTERIGSSGDRVVGSWKEKRNGSMAQSPAIPISSVTPCLRGETRAPLLALRLFRPPMEAHVQLRDGRPRHVSCAAVRGAVIWLAGPWRTSGEWWQTKSTNAASEPAAEQEKDTPWGREEWDVALKQEETGLALYRIFRDLIGGKWFVEGEYD
jgi:protein ImuB